MKEQCKNYYSADDVADFFLLQINSGAGENLSNLKLQKLLYYTQAWYLAFYNRPFFNESIQAWRYGPVVKDIYYRFKEYGYQAIENSDVKDNPFAKIAKTDIEFLSKIWEKYGSYSAVFLKELTHKHIIWQDEYKPIYTDGKCNNIISNDKIEKYFTENKDDFYDLAKIF